jgi:hypothetical protein
MQPITWERLADALFWLQLGWVVAGFGLMAYLAIKVMPRSSTSRNETENISSKPNMVVLGGYRFEITQETGAARPKVVELRPDYVDGHRRTR